MYHNVKKMFLTLFLVGSISQLQSVTPACPVNHHVTLSCENVVMEGLWTRLGNDMNSVAALNLATTDPLLVEAFDQDAHIIFNNISGKISPTSTQLPIALDNWWDAYIDFYKHSSQGGGTGNPFSVNYSNATTALGKEFKNVYTPILSADDLKTFDTVISSYLTALYFDSTYTVTNFTIPFFFPQAAEFSGFVLRDSAVLGVYLDKSLSGTVP